MTADFDERAVFVRGPVVVFKWRNAPGWPVEYVSPNAAEVFGHSPIDFLNGTVAYGELIDPADSPRVGTEVSNATVSGAASFVHEPYRVRNRDGSIRWLHDVTQVLRDAEGTATHYLGYVVDITSRMQAEEERRDLERRLLHAQKLESLGLLAGGVAHDFNNILTSILGQASLAQLILEKKPRQVRESLEQIEKAATRAAGLTRQLLAYSGRGRFVVQPVNLADVVREMVGMLEIVLSKKAILRLDLGDDVPAIVADRDQIQQIVMNLITNASEALEDQAGVVTIRVQSVQLSSAELETAIGAPALPGGQYVCLEVSDTGCGMSEDVQARLFDPFFTTKFTGRGLGMSAVLGIVKGHRGAITVTSSKGNGTTFRLAFPASNASVLSQPPPAKTVSLPTDGTILVVDDETEVRETAAAILAANGFRVLTAKDGAECVSVFREKGAEISLILLDLTMPVMDGQETLRVLRGIQADLPVVLSSGYDEVETTARLRNERPTGFVHKPYLAQDLIAAVVAAWQDRS
ncbi:MAG: response regulator [Polyangiaceae bacterium]|nr:response regulator [Polyangiaceae bacterium]